MKINKEFDLIHLHDTKIISVTKNNNDIILSISNAFLINTHSQSDNKNWKIEQAKLSFNQATDEKLEYFDGSRKIQWHTQPKLPIEHIMKTDVNNGFYRLAGFSDKVPWCEWSIKAERFSFELIKYSKHRS